MNSGDNASVTLSDEDFQELEHLAGIGYGLRKIALYFRLSYHDVQFAYDKCTDPVPGTIRYHYERGQLKVAAETDGKVVSQAKDGNLTAVQIFLKQKRENEIRDLKEQILNGHR